MRACTHACMHPCVCVWVERGRESERESNCGAHALLLSAHWCQSIQFGAMSSSIGSSSEPLLKKVVLLLKGRPHLHVRVEGHTCTAPSWGVSNQELSEQRSVASVMYACARCIVPACAVAVGRGARVLLCWILVELPVRETCCQGALVLKLTLPAHAHAPPTASATRRPFPTPSPCLPWSHLSIPNTLPCLSSLLTPPSAICSSFSARCDSLIGHALPPSRARSVKDYLVKFGITPERLASIGWGEKLPMFPHSQKSKNRRVEFHIQGRASEKGTWVGRQKGGRGCGGRASLSKNLRRETGRGQSLLEIRTCGRDRPCTGRAARSGVDGGQEKEAGRRCQCS